MALVDQWRKVATQLPAGWEQVRLRLVLERPAEAPRAATLLGPLAPGLARGAIDLAVDRRGAQGPELAARVLGRLDEEEIAGTLDLVAAVESAASREPSATGLAGAWDELTAALPDDWSDLLCLIELRSSDDLAPAALALAPLNPSRHGETLAFRFRVARRFGYGAAPQMTRRCLARLDEAGVRGTLRLLEGRADTRPVLTQGPTFIVGQRAV